MTISFSMTVACGVCVGIILSENQSAISKKNISLKIQVFLDVTSRKLVNSYQWFE